MTCEIAFDFFAEMDAAIVQSRIKTSFCAADSIDPDQAELAYLQICATHCLYSK